MKPLLNNTYGLYALIGFAAVFSLITPVNAQDITNSKEPLEITADGSLEWHRAQKRFIAIKNVQATQGDTSITAQTLTADYTDGKDNGFQISEVTADTDVIITARDSAAYGDHGIYNLKTGLATLTGQNLKAVSPDQTVTAQEKFEYFVPQGKLNAIGNAKAVRPDGKGGTNTLAADMLTATLKENAEGKRVLDTLEAKGNVVIITATERVTGTYGIYKAGSNIAELTGGVRITRGPNILTGERATVDLTTNTSRIFGNAAQNTNQSANQSQSKNGRVRAKFYPGSEDKPK